MDKDEFWESYHQLMEAEEKEREANKIQMLALLEKKVTPEYLLAIKEWIADEENGIWGDFKIVDKPIGEWQDEVNEYSSDDDYWQILKGMYVNQYCGYTGDDYHGTLEIRINENEFLRASFSL